MQCFNWKKKLFTEETQNMQDKKINVSRVSNVKQVFSLHRILK